jgi:hypothetical protein
MSNEQGPSESFHITLNPQMIPRIVEQIELPNRDNFTKIVIHPAKGPFSKDLQAAMRALAKALHNYDTIELEDELEQGT